MTRKRLIHCGGDVIDQSVPTAPALSLAVRRSYFELGGDLYERQERDGHPPKIIPRDYHGAPAAVVWMRLQASQNGVDPDVRADLDRQACEFERAIYDAIRWRRSGRAVR